MTDAFPHQIRLNYNDGSYHILGSHVRTSYFVTEYHSLSVYYGRERMFAFGANVGSVGAGLASVVHVHIVCNISHKLED